MKTYSKPEFYVTEFLPNEAVTYCAQNVAKYDFTANQTVECLRTSEQDNLFTGNTCNNDATEITNGYLISGDEVNFYDADYSVDGTYWWNDTAYETDNTQYYYLWHEGTPTSGTPDLSKSGFFGLINALLKAAGLNYTDMMWHAGFVDKSLVQQIGQPS